MKRYDLETVGSAYMLYETMVEQEGDWGDWVEWEDVEKLLAERDRYRAALGDLRIFGPEVDAVIEANGIDPDDLPSREAEQLASDWHEESRPFSDRSTKP